MDSEGGDERHLVLHQVFGFVSKVSHPVFVRYWFSVDVCKRKKYPGYCQDQALRKGRISEKHVVTFYIGSTFRSVWVANNVRSIIPALATPSLRFIRPDTGRSQRLHCV
jgi:hypothetical protein